MSKNKYCSNGSVYITMLMGDECWRSEFIKCTAYATTTGWPLSEDMTINYASSPIPWAMEHGFVLSGEIYQGGIGK